MPCGDPVKNLYACMHVCMYVYHIRRHVTHSPRHFIRVHDKPKHATELSKPDCLAHRARHKANALSSFPTVTPSRNHPTHLQNYSFLAQIERRIQVRIPGAVYNQKIGN
jgi:hypothetical protein